MRKSLVALIFLVLCPLLVTQQPQPLSDTTSIAPSGPPPPHSLLDGTPVKLRISETISSADAKVGQEIPFEVVEDVYVDQVAVLPKGATAIATVTEAEHKKSMGRAGKLFISISYARLADNEKVALRATQENRGGGHVGAMTTAIVATSIVFFPAAPLFLFIHGKDTTIPQGTEITAFVEGDMHLNMANFGVAPVAPEQAAPVAPAPDIAPPPAQPPMAPLPVPVDTAPPPAQPAPAATVDTAPPPALPAPAPQAPVTQATPEASAQASLSVDSTPSGADIEIDGAFVGNAPSTIPIAAGSHQIVIKKKGFSAWTRTLNVSGGTVHIAAELEQGP
jgi:PEGA domain